MNENDIPRNSKTSLLLNGIYPPLPTPFDEKGALALNALKSNIAILSEFDLRGFVVLGSNGEYVMLSQAEKILIMETAREVIPSNKLMIAGTGCQSTVETIFLTQKAAEIGADAALVINPSYYKGQMNPDAIISHYFEVADNSPIPILLYNMPANTGIDLDVETLSAIAKHANVLGLKDSSGNVVKMGTLRSQEGPAFQILAGSGGFLLPSLSIGAIGGILALANIAPDHCVAIHQLYFNGRIKEAQALQLSLISLNTAITSRWGVPALKAAMDSLGLYGGPTRAPLMPLSNDNKKIVNSMLIKAGLKK
ncbi:MAG: dihydrodipicolinate synthase family protein [Candidatus Omnitrophota bacterium]